MEKVGLRNRVRQLLGKIGEDASDLILDLLSEPDRDLRIFAAEILENDNSPRTARALIKALSDQDSNVRAAAAVSLGRRREQNAVTALIKLLSDDDWVAFAGVEALANIGDRKAFKPLVRLLDEGSELIRARTAEALGRLGDRRAMAPLLEVARNASGSLLAQSLVALVKMLRLRNPGHP